MWPIRALESAADLAMVAAFYDEAADYWLLADRRAPDLQKARDFFTDCPPGCDPARSHRLGLFEQDRLSGLAELSFGYPAPEDAYLGLMILAPRMRSRGAGRFFLARVAELARARGCPRLYLAVLDENARGRAFWEREGFRGTGLFRHDEDTGHTIRRMVRDL